MFISFGSTFYINSIFTHPDHIRTLDASNAGSFLGLIPLFFLLFILTILIISPFNSSYTPSNSITPILPSSLNSNSLINLNENIKIHSFTYNLLFLNHFNILNHWFMQNFLILSNSLYRYIDKGALEMLGPLGLSRTFHYLGFKLELLATGNILHYALIIIFSIFTLFSLIFFDKDLIF